MDPMSWSSGAGGGWGSMKGARMPAWTLKCVTGIRDTEGA